MSIYVYFQKMLGGLFTPTNYVKVYLIIFNEHVNFIICECDTENTKF